MTLDQAIENLEDVLYGGKSVQETDYWNRRLSAGVALQGIACTNSKQAERAWNTLDDAIVDADFRVAQQASLAVAYTATSTGEEWDRVCDIYYRAAKSADRHTRLAGVKGVRKAIELNPATAEDAAEILAEATANGLAYIIEHDDDVATIEDISLDRIRLERSSSKAMRGLCEVAREDRDAFEDVIPIIEEGEWIHDLLREGV